MTNTTVNVQISEVAKTVINNIKNATRNSPSGVSFVSIKGYTNTCGEVSDNLINVGASYENAKKSDIETLKNLDLTKFETKTDLITLEKARIELINAFIKPNENRSNGQVDAYIHLGSGIKAHYETGELYVYGYREKKTVIVSGDYPTVKSRELTIAKNELRKNLKTNKFTQYKVSNIEKMKLNGNTLEF